MNLYIVKKTAESLLIEVIASPEITREMRAKYKVIIEVGDIPGLDGKTYEADVRLKKRKTKQQSLFD